MVPKSSHILTHTYCHLFNYELLRSYLRIKGLKEIMPAAEVQEFLRSMIWARDTSASEKLSRVIKTKSGNSTSKQGET